VGKTETCTASIEGEDRADRELGPADGPDALGLSVRDRDAVSLDVVPARTITRPFSGRHAASGVVPPAVLALLLLLAGTGILFVTRRRDGGSEA